MATSARKSTQKTLSLAEAKEVVLDAIGKGFTNAEAASLADRSLNTYLDWMKKDPDFRAKVKGVRDAREAATTRGSANVVPDFETFCRDWLKQPLHPHQLRILDVLEGRPPRDLHPSMTWEDGQAVESVVPALVGGRRIFNIPPGHAKTTTFSINWVTWLIHKDPNLRIIIVSKDQGLAKQILGAVKFRLTSPVYREMHIRFAPEHADGTRGWKDPDQSWTQTEIYVQGKGDGEKDPTLQALGIGGRIYGARSDVIILDDAVTLANVNEFEKQHIWLDQEVESRLDGSGVLALFGTRVAPHDLYKEMRAVEDWDGQRVYSYLSMPALLEEGDGTDDHWVPLWPEKFPPRRLRKIRRDPRRWALVYQQQDVASDATFHQEAIRCAINGMRRPGPLTPGAPGGREKGMEGLYVIGGVDPASVGHTAFIIKGLDRANINSRGEVSPKRYLLDGLNRESMPLGDLQQAMKDFTEKYGVNEWVIERNAAQLYLLQDKPLNLWMQQRGVRMTPHHTQTSNKLDPDFGVAAMSLLFESCGHPRPDGRPQWLATPPEDHLIDLPDPRDNSWVAQYINQLVTWQPSGMKDKAKTDLVMADWFTEIAVQRILGYGRERMTHLSASRWTQKGQLKARHVINLAELREQKLLEGRVS